MIKIHTLLVVLTVMLTLPILGQNKKRTIEASNCRDGESIEYCHSHKKMQELLNNPVEKQKYLAYQAEQTLLAENQSKEKKGTSQEKATIYKIPVVFHVLHNDGTENISREQILDGLAIMNRDYRRLNADANDVSPEFQGLAADIEIEFVLATKAPNGACFGGITRTKNILTFDGSDGHLQSDAVVGGNDVFRGDWPGNKYMNVFVCSEIGGAAGYTRLPYSSEMDNGIWVLSSHVGSTGTSSINRSRTLTHEVGHWLNLSHVWGGTNKPGVACGDDGVNDTPITKGFTNCTINTKVCNPSIVENIENYMDYSYCSKMFTSGQKSRMRNALTSSTGGRNNLWTANNLSSTGANGILTLCKADFTPSKSIICSGESITMKDASTNIASSWSWTTTGGTPTTSNQKNPVITYATPGSYTVSLTVSYNGTTLTETKTKVIQVMATKATLPFFEGFDNFTNIDDASLWSISDKNGVRPFEISNDVGFSAKKCAKLSNFRDTIPGAINELGSSKFDLSSLKSTDIVTLSFKYAYRKKIEANSESLKLFITTDCGTNWIVRKTLTGSTLSTLTSKIDWSPESASDWTTVHVTSITNSYFSPNFRFQFQFTGNGGNNLFIDDINLYKGTPSDALVLGIEETNLTSINDVQVYPNPSEGELNVHFSIPTNNEVNLRITDVTGKIVQFQKINGVTGSNLVLLNTQSLTSGMYFLNYQVGNFQKTTQFIVK